VTPAVRDRLRHVGLAALAIVVGMLVHFHGSGLGAAAQDVTGDALWAAMIAWALGAIAPRTRLVVRSAIAYAWCVVVELSQLYHAPALDTLRETRLGHLALGSGFDPRDLVAYAIGVAVAAGVSVSLRAGQAGPARG
jgi:hypothetical protein